MPVGTYIVATEPLGRGTLEGQAGLARLVLLHGRLAQGAEELDVHEHQHLTNLLEPMLAVARG